MKTRNGKFGVEGMLALVLFGTFALCVLAVLLGGAQAYQRITRRGQETYDRRTAAQYIVTRVHQADGDAVVTVRDGCVLELSDTVGDAQYITRIYCHDGYLRELFSDASLSFDPRDGECILPAQSMEFSLRDGLLTAVITDAAGEETELSVALRSRKGANYAQ